MSEEEKRLLLIDLCGRLPYGVIIETTWKEKGADENCDGTIGKLRGSQIEFFEEGEYSDIKPYLRPMSSMTEEEANEWAKASNMKFDMEDGFFDAYDAHLSVDWLNRNHFDYRGLIPMGLALEAKEGMYNIKEK